MRRKKRALINLPPFKKYGGAARPIRAAIFAASPLIVPRGQGVPLLSHQPGVLSPPWEDPSLMMMEFDDLSVSPSTIPPEHHGAFRLWLRVFHDSFLFLRNGGFPGQVERSRSFIFDPENEFFEYVAHGLGVDPDGLRSRVKKAIRGGK